MNMNIACEILHNNLKGNKLKVNSVEEIALAAHVVSQNMSMDKIKKMFRISHTMFDRIKKIYLLSNESKKIIKKHNFGIEQSYHITKFNKKQQLEFAKTIVGMNTNEVRIFVRSVLDDQKKPISDHKLEFDQKMDNERMDIIIIPVNGTIYRKLINIAKKMKKDPHDFAYDLLTERLNEF